MSQGWGAGEVGPPDQGVSWKGGGEEAQRAGADPSPWLLGGLGSGEPDPQLGNWGDGSVVAETGDAERRG